MWKMRQKQGTSQKSKLNYRQYSPTRLQLAFASVKEKKFTVAQASRKFNIPATTLRDRIDGRISLDTVKSGPSPIFTAYEETKLVDHIKQMASVGYGYTRAQVISKGSEYGMSIKKIAKPLSRKWFYGLMSRWPSLKVSKPSGLSIARAKSASPEVISAYFNDLEAIMTKYDLYDAPEIIYNIDEKGISAEHTSPYVVSGYEFGTPQAVTSARLSVTVIGCGNAIGTALPPYFVFPGQRMRSEFLQDVTPGATGTVSKSGWSNTKVFKQYLSEHFIKYAQNGSGHKLILYDGHRSHVHPDIIEWAKENNIVLFVFPPHTSQVLQPLDVGCFGPLEKAYSYEVQKYMKENIGNSVTKYDIASLVCKAYRVALNSSNLCASFKKSGIFPFKPKAFDQNKIIPHVVFQSDKQTIYPTENTSVKTTDFLDTHIDNFISDIETGVSANVQSKKPRNTLSRVSSGKPITEDNISRAIVNHIEGQKRKMFKTPYKTNLDSTPKSSTSSKTLSKIKKSLGCTPKQSTSSTSKTPKKRPCTISQVSNVHTFPQAGPSNFVIDSPNFEDNNSDNDLMQDDELCCVCNLFSPADLHKRTSFVIVDWAQCDRCNHWTHLKFCSKIVSCGRNQTFLCPHCAPDTAVEEE